VKRGGDLNKNVINYGRNGENEGKAEERRGEERREDIKYLKYERLIYFF
jgi:hypothetical protein